METVLWVALGVGFIVLLLGISMKFSGRGYLGAEKTTDQYLDEADIRMRR
jgi:hypothetical protein